MLRRLPEDAFWGEAKLLGARPASAVHAEVLYRPKGESLAWGLYDREGALLPAAVDRWGAAGNCIDQVEEPAALGDYAQAPEADYAYIGRDQLHYGHFLLETLSRCWALDKRRPGLKLLVHGPELRRAWEGYQGHAFVTEIIRFLGFGPADLAHFDQPTRLNLVQVCEPALRQQAFAYPVYRELCLEIGARALRRSRGAWPGFSFPRRAATGGAGRRRSGPVWLSRARVYSGTTQVANEAELETALQARGFEIVHPELLGFSDQVRLMEEREVICGLAGSAFHTDIFAAKRGRRLILSLDDRVNSNFRLFDLLLPSPAAYFQVEGARLLEDLGPGHRGTDAQRFTRTFVFTDPAALADVLADRATSG